MLASQGHESFCAFGAQGRKQAELLLQAWLVYPVGGLLRGLMSWTGNRCASEPQADESLSADAIERMGHKHGRNEVNIKVRHSWPEIVNAIYTNLFVP